MAKGTQYSQQFKEDAVQYRKDHPELTLRKAAENLGISDSAMKTWIRSAKENEGTVPTRGSGNYANDEAKEIARLQRELRDTRDALEVLKKRSVFWENDKSSLCCYIRVCRGKEFPACETSGFCQRNTEKTRRFTFRLQYMEKSYPFRYGSSSCSFKGKDQENL